MNTGTEALSEHPKNNETEAITDLEKVLGRQVIDLLYQAGISNLSLDDEGSVCGSMQVVRGLPATDYIRGLTIRIKEDKIVIDGKIVESIEDIGKVI